jgi:preprotein translocase subunit SecF
MFIIKNQKIFLGLSLVIVLLSLLSVSMYGLKKSIDFTGGAKVSFSYASTTPVSAEQIRTSLATNFGEIKLNTLADNSYEATLRDLKEEDYTKLTQALNSVGNGAAANISAFTMTGPVVSGEIIKSAIWGVILVVLAIILFIWFSFRSVSYPVSSYKYGLITITTLIHDIIIPTGVFALLGHWYGVEVDALFIVAILTVIGISISDTIVVFDRIRENLKKASKNESFEHVVGKSLNETFVRSVATSAAVIIVLLCLVFFGPESTKYFSLTLTIGMFVGTYSSIFVASPLLVLAAKHWK